MPETLHPGLYVQELAGSPPVEGVSTAVAGFVGIAAKGLIGTAKLVTSWQNFVNNYGSFLNTSYLAYAVRNFFENGGTKCYISRVVHYTGEVVTSAKSTINLADVSATPVDVLTADALYDGTDGDNISVKITNWDDTLKTFDLEVFYGTNQVEVFADVDLTNIEDYINGVSEYITVTLLAETPGSVVFVNQTAVLTGGDDGIVDIADADYVTALDAFDNIPINLLAVPGIATVTVQTAMLTYVDARKDCFAILDMPLGKTPATAITYKSESAFESEYGALYYPWIHASDAIGVGKAPKKLLPPSGFIAGMFARIDNSRGVWKAPAGTECNLLGALELEYKITAAEQDTLNPVHINCIRSINGSIVSWGAKTLKKGDYKYIPVRRTNIYIESYLMDDLQWAVFEPNTDDTWKRIKTACKTFLNGLKVNSGIADFYVICDDTINTAETVAAGKTYVDIGVANHTPSEFIIIRLSLI